MFTTRARATQEALRQEKPLNKIDQFDEFDDRIKFVWIMASNISLSKLNLPNLLARKMHRQLTCDELEER